METAYQEYIRKVDEIVEPYLINIGEYFYKLGVNIWVKYGEKPISALYLYNPVSESSAMLYFSKRTKRYVIAGADEDREFRPKDKDKLYLPSDMLMSKYTLRWIAEKGVFLSKKEVWHEFFNKGGMVPLFKREAVQGDSEA